MEGYLLIAGIGVLVWAIWWFGAPRQRDRMRRGK